MQRGKTTKRRQGAGRDGGRGAGGQPGSSRRDNNGCQTPPDILMLKERPRSVKSAGKGSRLGTAGPGATRPGTAGKKPAGQAGQGKKRSGTEKCPVYQKCGGCQLLHMDYNKQLALKKQQVAELLKPYGRLEGIIGMEEPGYYRHKVHAAFGMDKRGRSVCGVYREGTHQIVPADSCFLENRKAAAIIQTVKRLISSFKIRVYDEDTGYGLLRHVLVRVGYHTGQIMVVLVLRSPILPSKNHFVEALRKEHPQITTIVVNVNDKRTSMVLGEKEQVIYGPGYIEDELCGMTFKISPGSFYQVNPVQTEILYGKALEYARLSGKETVLDAYCGTGTIGMIAAKKAQKCIGVELNRDAVRDAVAGARRNHVSNIRFYQADAGEFMEELAQTGERVDVVFMDPPRTGGSEQFLASLAGLRPGKIVYVSCNPETLARDLEYLCGRGYRMERAAAVDMFPFTGHVETVCLLSNTQSKKKESYITLDVEMADYYRIKNEGKNSTT